MERRKRKSARLIHTYRIRLKRPAMESNKSFLESTWGHIRAYCDTEIRIQVLKAAEKLSALSAEAIFMKLLLYMGLMCMLSGSVALALYIAVVTGHYHTGFLSVAGLYLLILLFMFIMRSPLKRMIQNRILKVLLKNYRNEEPEGA